MCVGVVWCVWVGSSRSTSPLSNSFRASLEGWVSHQVRGVVLLGELLLVRLGYVCIYSYSVQETELILFIC